MLESLSLSLSLTLLPEALWGGEEARLLVFFTAGHLPSKLGSDVHRLLRPVFVNVVINNIGSPPAMAISSTDDQYVVIYYLIRIVVCVISL